MLIERDKEEPGPPGWSHRVAERLSERWGVPVTHTYVRVATNRAKNAVNKADALGLFEGRGKIKGRRQA